MPKKKKTGGPTPTGAESLLALEPDDQEDFERRVAAHKRGAGAASQGSNIPGVVYLGHVPHGFYEKEMRGFFSQFGRVTRLRLSRSKRTGRSKGYAFVEFQHEEVAKIAADTMNNYLMFRQILKCEFIPPDRVHPETFKNCDRPFRPPTAQRSSRQRHNAEKTPQRAASNAKRRGKKFEKKMASLKEMGIEYECHVEALDLEKSKAEPMSVGEAEDGGAAAVDAAAVDAAD